MGIDMKFEIVVIPVSDVDRAKEFYGRLGWRLDADYDNGHDFRVIQFTPPGSGCSIIFGRNVTAAAPGSAQGLYLIVSDIEAARDELLGRGVGIGEVFHDAGGVYAGTDEPMIRTATAGFCRRSRRAEIAHGEHEKRTGQRDERRRHLYRIDWSRHGNSDI
jgi:catechol 2,3-dioxygenase-like lactoylglutathione lyase family enzyme